MANVRTAFDALVVVLRQHEATETRLAGKRCLAFEGEPFLVLHRDGVAFRLHGRALVRARAIEGSVDFDPLNPEEATLTRPGWVRIPAERFLSWERLGLDALQCARDARNRNVSWEVPPPAPEPATVATASSAAALKQRAQVVMEWGFDFTLEPLPG